MGLAAGGAAWPRAVPAIGSKEELRPGPVSRWSVVSAVLLADLLMRERRTRTNAR